MAKTSLKVYEDMREWEQGSTPKGDEILQNTTHKQGSRKQRTLGTCARTRESPSVHREERGRKGKKEKGREKRKEKKSKEKKEKKEKKKKT